MLLTLPVLLFRRAVPGVVMTRGSKYNLEIVSLKVERNTQPRVFFTPLLFIKQQPALSKSQVFRKLLKDRKTPDQMAWEGI